MSQDKEEMLDEYDISNGVRGKYAEKYKDKDDDSEKKESLVSEPGYPG